MENLIISPDIHAVIIDLANQLNISETDVVRQAISEYDEKIRKKKRLISFAGILDETEGDDLLRIIRNSRINKDSEPEL